MSNGLLAVLRSWLEQHNLPRPRPNPGTHRAAFPQARPRLERLEDRLAPTVAPMHVYELNGSLADELGGPSLVANGGAISGGRYVFGANQGLQLAGALANPASYSISMVLELDSLANFYNKLIDFRQLSSDSGLYLSGGRLQLYPGGQGPDAVAANTDFHLALTRDGALGETRIYLNGALQAIYGGSVSGNAVSPANVLTFFEDDFATGRREAVGGSVDRILIFDQPLSAQEVAALHENSAPVLGVDATTVTVAKGHAAVNTGTWSDPEFEPLSLSASVGTIIQNADGTWSWHLNTQGVSDSQTVTITALDPAGVSATVTFDLVVTNAPPEISTLTSSHGSQNKISENGRVSISGAFADADAEDVHTVTVDWGDGVSESLTSVDQIQRRFDAGHTYAQGGVYTITVTVRDEDGSEASHVAKAFVAGVGLRDGTLYVVGTKSSDKVEIDVHRGRLRVQAWLGGKKQSSYFDLDDVQRIMVVAGKGNDLVKIHRKVKIEAVVFGGAGHDFLQAGRYDRLVGGQGVDLLVKGRSFKIA